MIPLPVIPSATEEITGSTTEIVNGANKVPRNQPSSSFIIFFTLSVN